MHPIPKLLLRLPLGGPALALVNPSAASPVLLLGVVRPQRGSSSTATETTSPKKEGRARNTWRKPSPEESILLRALFQMYQRGQVPRSMLMLGRVKRPVEAVTVTLQPDGKISLSEPVYTPSGDVWDTRSLEAEWQKFYEAEKNALSTPSGSEQPSSDDGSGDSSE